MYIGKREIMENQRFKRKLKKKINDKLRNFRNKKQDKQRTVE